MHQILSVISCLCLIFTMPYIAPVKWDDPDPLSTLETILGEHPDSVAIYAQSIISGKIVEYSADKIYNSGSVIKAFYCKWLETLEIDMNMLLTLKASDVSEFGGNFSKLALGSKLTVKQCISAAICYSDNTAYNMLLSAFGYEAFNEYLKLYGGEGISPDNKFGNLSSRVLGKLLLDLYQWNANSDVETYTHSCMKSTDYVRLIPSAFDCVVAHKYGYNGDALGFHDVAIVYADTPFIIVICSTLDNNNYTVDYFHRLSKAVSLVLGDV